LCDLNVLYQKHCTLYKAHTKCTDSYEHSIKFRSTASYKPGVLFNVDTWTARDMTCPMYDIQHTLSCTDIPAALFISLQIVFHPYNLFPVTQTLMLFTSVHIFHL